MRHSEFELYNIKNDPWELMNLDDNPACIKRLKEMNTQLKVDMEKLTDRFSIVDAKRSRKRDPG